MSADDWGVLLIAFLLVCLVCRTLAALARQPPPRPTTAYQMEFRRTRRIVLARDGHHCQYPGCPRQGSGMHVHHIKARQYGGSNQPANLVTLCPTHHQLIHGRRF